ncbi:unnamed protein product, partial [Amoebophrya sp. A25]
DELCVFPHITITARRAGTSMRVKNSMSKKSTKNLTAGKNIGTRGASVRHTTAMQALAKRRKNDEGKSRQSVRLIGDLHQKISTQKDLRSRTTATLQLGNAVSARARKMITEARLSTPRDGEATSEYAQKKMRPTSLGKNVTIMSRGSWSKSPRSVTSPRTVTSSRATSPGIRAPKRSSRTKKEEQEVTPRPHYMTPRSRDRLAAASPDSASPSARKTASPSARKSASPSARKSASPSGRKSASPSGRKSASPTGIRKASPSISILSPSRSLAARTQALPKPKNAA